MDSSLYQEASALAHLLNVNTTEFVQNALRRHVEQLKRQGGEDFQLMLESMASVRDRLVMEGTE